LEKRLMTKLSPEKRAELRELVAAYSNAQTFGDQERSIEQLLQILLADRGLLAILDETDEIRAKLNDVSEVDLRIAALTKRTEDAMDRGDATMAELRKRAEAAEVERDEAREWVRKVTRDSRVLTCVYCAHTYPPGSPTHGAEELTAHIRVCEKHPMRAAERELAELRESLRQAGDTCRGFAAENQELRAALKAAQPKHEEWLTPQIEWPAPRPLKKEGE
jgi:hypothetical protein